MISCLLFKKKLNDYIYDYLAEDFKLSMEEHIKGCKSCQRLYEQELQVNDAFRDTLDTINIRFISSREDIMRNIDKNRYRKGLSNKLYYGLRKNMATLAASILILITIASGSLYFYSIYASKAGTPSSHEKDFNLVETTDIPTINETTTPKEDNKTIGFIERELPLPKVSDDNVIQEILQKIENEPIGVAPFTIGYANNKKIVFYNHSVLLAYSYSSSSPVYYAGIDLGRIDAGHVQGSVYTDISFSPDGDYAVINNGTGDGGFSNNKYPMFIYNLKKGEMNIISYENKFNIKDAWSSSSNYYAFGDKTGERIFVYDTISGTESTLPFNKGGISSIFISDYGDIIIESLSVVDSSKTLIKYILKRDNSYQPEEYFIPGEIIGMRENSILYYCENTIYKLISGESFEIKTLGPGFNIQKLKSEYALFTDGTSTYAYDYMDGFYKYPVSFTENDFIELSPDLKKAAFINSNGAKIIYADNIKGTLEISFPPSFSSSYKWLGNNSLVRVSQMEKSNTLSQLILYKVDISGK